MNRIEFMAQLDRLLRDIPESERSDAIAYYNDYFDAAGPEKEAQLIGDLGSPGKVAATIKASIRQSIYQEEYTENGYQNQTVKEMRQSPAARFVGKSSRRGVGSWILLIILGIFFAPMVLGIGGSLLGTVLGALGALVGVVFALIFGGGGFLIGGIAGVIAGVIECFTNPASGLLMMGGGMLVFSVSLLLVLLGLWCLLRLLPKVIRFAKDMLSKIVHGFRGGNQE